VDMAARAQVLRRHNHSMCGVPLPAPAIPPAPVVTPRNTAPASTGRVGSGVYWQSSPVAKELASSGRDRGGRVPWTTVCKRCVTDLDDGFVDDCPGANGVGTAASPTTSAAGQDSLPIL
jgi:hypothetical protein